MSALRHVAGRSRSSGAAPSLLAARAVVRHRDVLVQFGISALLLATLAQGWNIIGGYTGYASFGNSVFYGLGAYGVGDRDGAVAPAVLGRACCSALVLAVVFALLLGLAGAAAARPLLRHRHARRSLRS